MKTFHRQLTPFAGLLSAVLFTSAFTASATVLDNFNDNIKTGWTDTLSGGSVSEAGQRFDITTSVGAGAVTSSKKTSESFAVVAGKTLELRVDVGAVTPAFDPNPSAVLAWVPTGNALFAAGYSLSMKSTEVKLQKGGVPLWTSSLPGGIQNSNVTLVLRLTPSGSAMTVNVRVYKQTGTALLQNFTVLSQYTATDPGGLIGIAGNATLGVVNQASPTGSSVSFDNLQVFELSNGVLDNFTVADGLSGWAVAKKNAADEVVEESGQLRCKAYLASGGGFATTYNTAKTFKIVDGGRVEFRVDMVNNNTLNNTYTLLGYLPAPGTGGANIYSLLLYHVAARAAGGGGGSTALANGKNYNGWWSALAAPPNGANMRYTMILTGEGGNVRIESIMEDLNFGVNDPGRVVYQNVYLDTPANDGFGEAIPAPYANVDGNFTIGVFNDGAFPPAFAEALFDNAEYSETIPENAAPTFVNISPPYASNFVASASVVSFNVQDDTNAPIDSIVLTLNGVRYTNGSPGVSITGGNQNRLFTLTGALSPNVNYVGTLEAADNAGLTSSLDYVFDTFLTNNLILESEEFNFGGGLFIDNPLLIPEGSIDANAYNDQTGVAEVDFHDNQVTVTGGYEEHTFRINDLVHNSHSGDPARAKYILAGGAAASFYEQMVNDIHDGDWLNYTKTYPAGAFNVYLRQSQYLIEQSLVTLERVTSDRTLPNQTTAALGSFLGAVSGLDRFRNVPLTDGVGNPLVVRFPGGVDTLRVTGRVTGNNDDEVGGGILLQNYLVLIPAPDPGVLRPIVAAATPGPNSTVVAVSPVTTATIANRDTTVVTGTIQLRINGSAVAATVTPTGSGADLSYTFPVVPPPLPGSSITNTVIFQDSGGVWQTNTWTWTLNYPLLYAANSVPVGSVTNRGWEYRMVWTNGPTLGNSLSRAEQQLAIPPDYPYLITTQTVIQVLNWDDANALLPVPGLEPAGGHDNIAVEAYALLELTAGPHRFRVVSDDGFQLRSGASLRDPAATVLGSQDDGTFNGTFDFVVEATGLYPVRLLWYENGSGASFSMYSVDLSPPNTQILINDPGNPSAVKAYLPYGLVSSASVGGTYTPAAGHVVNTLTKTITVPRSGATQFYRVISFDPLNPNYQPAITGITVGATTVTITYN